MNTRRLIQDDVWWDLRDYNLEIEVISWMGLNGMTFGWGFYWILMEISASTSDLVFFSLIYFHKNWI